jgi:hypothetical protein
VQDLQEALKDEEGREQQWLKELERKRRVSLRDPCNSPLAHYIIVSIISRKSCDARPDASGGA